MRILIVGSGIIGNFIAAELVRLGNTVLIAEKRTRSFLGATRSAFGSLTPFSDPFFRGEARQFAAHSVDLYRQVWIPLLAPCRPITFHDEGLLQLFATAPELDKQASHINDLRTAGFEARILTTKETLALEPHLSRDFAAALWLNEPWLDKDELVEALTTHLAQTGLCSFRFSTEVTGVRQICSDTVEATFASGQTEVFDFIVLAEGLNSQVALSPISLKWVRGDCVGVTTNDGLPVLRRHVYMHNGFITPRRNGSMLLGATYITETAPSLSREEQHAQIEVNQLLSILRETIRILPSIRECDVIRTWRGWRPTLADQFPALGPHGAYDRIIIANGFIGLGLTMAPAVAEAVATYICNHDMSRFPSSFSTSRIFGTGVV